MSSDFEKPLSAIEETGTIAAGLKYHMLLQTFITR